MAWNTVASYSSYEEAQAAVDRLSDEGFPVENLEIIGSGLRLVERVTGRLTTARAAAAGAASGAWFGLFIGLLVGLFTRGPVWIGLIIGGLLIGAAWGAVFGFVSHAATRGRRDFSSAQTLNATRYDIIARGGTAQMCLAEDQHPVREFTAQGADEARACRVHPRRPHGRAPHCIPAVQAALGAEPKQGNATHDVSEQLLETLTRAYREAGRQNDHTGGSPDSRPSVIGSD